MSKSLVLVCNCGGCDGRLVLGISRDVIAITCCLYSILGILMGSVHASGRGGAFRGQSKQRSG